MNWVRRRDTNIKSLCCIICGGLRYVPYPKYRLAAWAVYCYCYVCVPEARDMG